jgi:hypothetical protein
MPTNFKFDKAAINRLGLDIARREVTDTTRRVLTRAIVLTPVDTGLLRAANQMRVRVQGLTVTGEVFNPTIYADAVHSGSRAHVVRPRRKKVLRFVVGGQVVFARKVTIPARRGRPWLYRALVEVAKPRGYQVSAT